jgi:hypothetical protein
MVAPNGPGIGRGQRLAKIAAVKKIVAEHEGGGRAGEEVGADEERLGEPVGLGLLGVGKVEAELRAVAEQALEQRQILRGGDDEDLPDAGEHQHRQRVVDHRLVVHRHELFAHGDGERVKPGAGPAGEDDAAAGRRHQG